MYVLSLFTFTHRPDAPNIVLCTHHAPIRYKYKISNNIKELRVVDVIVGNLIVLLTIA